jgi:hypothetical protein
MATSWLVDERLKREIDRPEIMIRLGDAQQQVSSAFLDVVAGSLKTRMLAGFFIDAAGQWLSTPRLGSEYTLSLNATAPLRERMAARKSAAALMRTMERLHAWDSEHRSMHFLDDDFAEGQALIQDWSGFGDGGFREALRLTSELDALPG